MNLWYCICLIVFAIVNSCAKNWLREVLCADTSAIIQKVLSHPEKYKLQIIVSLIERDKNGYPSIKKYQLGQTNYFYPASIYKLPLCFVALEKLKKLNNDKINLKTDFYCETDKCYPFVLTDEKDNYIKFASIEDLIVLSLVFSDNLAPKLLYEFVGEEFLNERIKKLGLQKTKIKLNFGFKEKITSQVKWAFWSNDYKWILENYSQQKTESIPVKEKIYVGRKSFINGKIINKPWDFSQESQIDLSDLHYLMEAIIFPELNLLPHTLLSISEINFLQNVLSSWPRNKQNPFYYEGCYFPDNYRKYLYIGDIPKDSIIPTHITIANKVGLAYGFMTDVSYYKDNLNKIELLISTTLYLNENEIINDGKYEYESIGLPFMAQLGRKLIELQKEKSFFHKLKIDF
jgi:hypothetical protein